MFVNEIVNTVDTQSFEEFMENFDGLEYQKSFATNQVVKKPLRSNGLISTYDLFQDLASSGEPVDDIPEFLEEYGQMEVVSCKNDNTYNYCGYLDNYVNFSVYDLENDQVLVTLAVCLGLDPRGGYTDSIALIFESEDDFLEVLDEAFQLMDFEIKVDGKEYYGSFDATALSEYGYLSLDDKETGENVYYDEVVLDATDKEDIIENVAEVLGVDANSIEINEINYFWYGSR